MPLTNCTYLKLIRLNILNNMNKMNEEQRNSVDFVETDIEINKKLLNNKKNKIAKYHSRPWSKIYKRDIKSTWE